MRPIKDIRDVGLSRKMFIALYKMKHLDGRNLVYVAGTIYVINEEYVSSIMPIKS